MNWKQIIFTAAITLIVTIISGILVNWYTTENINTVKTEELVFDTQKITRFKSDSINIAIFSFNVSNIGNIKSENVSIKLDFEKSAQLIDVSCTLERTGENYSSTSKNKDQLTFEVETLFPNDNLKINVVLEDLIQAPSIIVQSNNSIGKPFDSSMKKEPEETSSIIKITLVLILTLLLLVPILFLTVSLYRRIKGYPTNLNNTAFLALHNNQFDLANELLLKKIKNDGGSASELANYALAKCLAGVDKEKYQPLLRMAEFVSSGKRLDLIITFNKMIIAAYNSEYEQVSIEFNNSVKLDKKEFKKWYFFSNVLKELRRKDNSLDNRLKELEKTLPNKTYQQ